MVSRTFSTLPRSRVVHREQPFMAVALPLHPSQHRRLATFERSLSRSDRGCNTAERCAVTRLTTRPLLRHGSFVANSRKRKTPQSHHIRTPAAGSRAVLPVPYHRHEHFAGRCERGAIDVPQALAIELVGSHRISKWTAQALWRNVRGRCTGYLDKCLTKF